MDVRLTVILHNHVVDVRCRAAEPIWPEWSWFPNDAWTNRPRYDSAGGPGSISSDGPDARRAHTTAGEWSVARRARRDAAAHLL